MHYYSSFWLAFASGAVTLHPEFALRDTDEDSSWTKRIVQDGHAVDYVKSGKVYYNEFGRYKVGDVVASIEGKQI